MKIALASDHAGFILKDHLADYLRQQGHDVHDFGVDTDAVRADYPDAAASVATALTDGTAERGILACGSGVGASIAANKYPGIYAAICHDTYSAHQGVEHDNMNVLVVGAQVIGKKVAEELSEAFLSAEFVNKDRYLDRFNMIKAVEENDN